MSTFPPPSTAAAGWYPDPDGHGLRYFDGRSWAQPHPGFAERQEHPSLPVSAAVGALVVLVVSLIVGRLLVDHLLRYDWPTIAYVAVLGVVGYGPSLGWVIYVRRRWGTDRFRSLGWSFRWSDLAWGVLTWVAAVGVQIVCVAVVVLTDIPFSSNVESAADLDTDQAYIVAVLVTAVIAAPVIEELVFRGLVLRGLLSRVRVSIAIVAQGVLFGVAHVDPVRGTGNIGLALVLSGVGVALGVAAYVFRRLGPTVIAHAIFNGVAMAIVLSGFADDIRTELSWLALALF